MSPTENSNALNQLLQAIRQRTVFDHPVTDPRIIETHISYVLLTGRYAYKFKKPVDLGFLDFRTLALRKFFCEEELRLNRRLAPSLYLGVVAFTGSSEQPLLNGDGPVLEYAVKMTQFAEGGQALRLLQEGCLTERHIDQLAEQLAKFHASVAIAGPDSPYGVPESVLHDALENFTALRTVLRNDGDYGRYLDQLQAWTTEYFKALEPAFSRRHQQGYVRECHGDLHLGNIVLHKNAMLIFDCIEFAPAFRWIDVMNDLAFLIMDLHERLRPLYAQRLLNDYLQLTGDYEGLAVLRFYLVYRALVRSKVAAIRLGQVRLRPGDADREIRDEHGYLDLARQFTRPAAPALIITHGLSGSGKSRYSRVIADKLAAIWLRSDVERKRLHGLQATARSRAGLRSGIYSPESTTRTFRRLAGLSRMILQAGYPVIVDAAFLQKHTRRIFQKIASESRAAFLILDFQADTGILRERIQQRRQQGHDASEADGNVLDDQIRTQDPLDDQERKHSITLDTAASLRADSIIEAITSRLGNTAAGLAPDLGAG